MEHKTCEFCGTEYDSTQEKCPLCGRVNEASAEGQEAPKKKKRRVSSSKGARVAQKQSGSGKGWKIACIVLGVLVLAGIAGFFYVMDFGNDRFDPNGIPTLLDPEQMLPPEPAEPAEPEVPVEPEKPEVPAEPLPGQVTGLTISQNEVTMEKYGDRVFLTAVARPADTEEEIFFESSDESVVLVMETGMLTAVGPGDAEVRVTCGDITEVCVVHCVFELPEEPEEDPEAEPEETPDETENPDEKPEETEEPEQKPEESTEIKLVTEDFTLFKKGETTNLAVLNAPEGMAISYVSSDPKVAAVDANGTVTAVANGTANITVTVGDLKLTCIARCNLGETYTGPFKISNTDVTLSKGETFRLTLTDSTGKVVANPGWAASNGCVTISGNEIKNVSGGQCTVSVTFEGSSFSCIVRCKA